MGLSSFQQVGDQLATLVAEVAQVRNDQPGLCIAQLPAKRRQTLHRRRIAGQQVHQPGAASGAAKLPQPFGDLPAAGSSGCSHQLVSGSNEISGWKCVELTDDLVQLASHHLHSHSGANLAWLLAHDAS